MLVAENKLMSKEMARKIEQVQAARPIPTRIFNYGSMGGDLGFKQSMAAMMQHWIDAPVHPDFLQFQDGAGPMLSQIAFILTDPGDAVLTAAPGYMAFASDFGTYAGAKFYWIDTDADQGFIPTIQQLNDGYSRAVKAGNPPRIFVICQPQNPTGVVYSKDTMMTLIDWALSKNLHVVSDEIYALSTFPGYHTTSAADVMHAKHPNHTNFLGTNVHVVAGLSKDWGMSGFRVGSLFSHNIDLLNALETVGYYSSPSRYTQFLLQGIFDDHEFVTWYIAENRRRLYETYQALEAALSLIQVPLLPSQGAIFAWADFSAYILEGQTERDLWIELFDKTKVALTSGQSCQSSKPGMFRIVYGWPEGGVTAMEELGHRLVQWKADREASSARIYLAVEHPMDELLS
jgi:aspartate/methionine/tyrosine aminotransferase